MKSYHTEVSTYRSDAQIISHFQTVFLRETRYNDLNFNDVQFWGSNGNRMDDIWSHMHKTLMMTTDNFFPSSQVYVLTHTQNPHPTIIHDTMAPLHITVSRVATI